MKKNNKGFFSIILVLTGTILLIILFNSTFLVQSKDSSTQIIPKINNYVSGVEIDLKNLSYDCNWEKEVGEIEECIINGVNEILSQKTNDLIECEKISLESIDENKFKIKINCENKNKELESETRFELNKIIPLTRPN